MIETKNNIALEIALNIALFAPKMSAYDLGNNNSFKRRRINNVCHGTECPI